MQNMINELRRITLSCQNWLFPSWFFAHCERNCNQLSTYNQGGVFIKLFSLFFLKTTDPSTIRLGCDDDNTLEDYELHDLKRKSILRGHNGPIYDVTFMPRSKYALSVSEDTTMRLWDLETGINKAMYQGHSYPIWSVDSDRVGINIATGKLTS